MLGKKICGCCTDTQAIERAVGMIRTMGLDGECPQGMMATGVAMITIASNLLCSQVSDREKRAGLSKREAELMSHIVGSATMGSIEKQIHEAFRTNNDLYVATINELGTVFNEHMKRESELPKDT